MQTSAMICYCGLGHPVDVRQLSSEFHLATWLDLAIGELAVGVGRIIVHRVLNGLLLRGSQLCLLLLNGSQLCLMLHPLLLNAAEALRELATASGHLVIGVVDNLSVISGTNTLSVAEDRAASAGGVLIAAAREERTRDAGVLGALDVTAALRGREGTAAGRGLSHAGAGLASVSTLGGRLFLFLGLDVLGVVIGFRVVAYVLVGHASSRGLADALALRAGADPGLLCGGGGRGAEFGAARADLQLSGVAAILDGFLLRAG